MTAVVTLLYDPAGTQPLALDLGAHLRRFFDVHYFVWVFGWIARRIVEAPGSLFDAHGPVYAVSGNPILAYNVTVVLFQALAGWAGYYAAHRLTGSSLAGWVGGIVFALSTIRTGYYHFAHMQLSFAMPLAFLAFARFLERQRVRDLAWALFFLWCQMVTVIYFGIPLSLMLETSTARASRSPRHSSWRLARIAWGTQASSARYRRAWRARLHLARWRRARRGRSSVAIPALTSTLIPEGLASRRCPGLFRAGPPPRRRTPWDSIRSAKWK